MQRLWVPPAYMCTYTRLSTTFGGNRTAGVSHTAGFHPSNHHPSRTMIGTKNKKLLMSFTIVFHREANNRSMQWQSTRRKLFLMIKRHLQSSNLEPPKRSTPFAPVNWVTQLRAEMPGTLEPFTPPKNLLALHHCIPMVSVSGHWSCMTISEPSIAHGNESRC